MRENLTSRSYGEGLETGRRPIQVPRQPLTRQERYPRAEKIRVILDNLNTHGPGSLYEAFAPAEARRLVEKLEFHYTPKHGSWLNMAEIELSILQRQCLARRIADEATLKQEVAAWETRRNQEQATIDWRFSITDARKKLRRLYPSPLVR